ncbi:hypothetical protein B0J12DRAFT_703504 [Macrophomina phaseolina]|uniref:Uncharacterized protein n=1 Tax=Macrophomina phaseolina TaxID=35725 RepID=A0ABQ8FY94_9PEZI|nr:hypothetical protein B0J12DRAFT_703504 [Macrophomina phaseolina]
MVKAVAPNDRPRHGRKVVRCPLVIVMVFLHNGTAPPIHFLYDRDMRFRALTWATGIEAAISIPRIIICRGSRCEQGIGREKSGIPRLLSTDGDTASYARIPDFQAISHFSQPSPVIESATDLSCAGC